MNLAKTLVLTCAALGLSVAAHAQDIVVNGSTTVLPVMQSRGMYLVAQGSAPTASQGIALLTYTLSGDALQAKQNYAIAEYYVRRIHPTQS